MKESSRRKESIIELRGPQAREEGACISGSSHRGGFPGTREKLSDLFQPGGGGLPGKIKDFSPPAGAPPGCRIPGRTNRRPFGNPGSRNISGHSSGKGRPLSRRARDVLHGRNPFHGRPGRLTLNLSRGGSRKSNAAPAGASSGAKTPMAVKSRRARRNWSRVMRRPS